MSSATLYRWSGVILLVGSLIGVIGSFLDPMLPNETAQQILSTPFPPTLNRHRHPALSALRD